MVDVSWAVIMELFGKNSRRDNSVISQIPVRIVREKWICSDGKC